MLACELNEHLAVADSISNLTCGFYVFVYWCSLQCADAPAHARGSFCIVSNWKVAMLAWELK